MLIIRGKIKIKHKKKQRFHREEGSKQIYIQTKIEHS